jgi:aspartyl-tRNA(Asn)/glutamyl-tRNA(Gln) amidotransferase subunit A
MNIFLLESRFLMSNGLSKNTNSILEWDLSELSSAYNRRKLSPTEIVQSSIERISSTNDLINSFITVCQDTALEEAKQAEIDILQGRNKGLLHGVPIALKDLIYTRNTITTMGSGAFAKYVPDYDATVVSKLKAAGAIIIGKTNTHELAYGPTGDYSYFGAIRNPYDVSKLAGGSSGGSAAAVASYQSCVALGTDTSGSIRIPASCCGVVGMKPTFGRVSKHGVYPLSWTMDHVGPITRTVMDNAILLNHLIGFDKKDPYSNASLAEDFTSKMGLSLEGTIIGIPLTPFFDHLQEEVKDKLLISIKLFEKLGATVKITNIPFMEDILEACRVVTRSEAYVINEELALTKGSLIGNQIRERILQGAEYKASEYVKAQQIKNEARQCFTKWLEEVDVIITPTIPILPPDIGQDEVIVESSSENVRAALIRLTCPTNLIGFPSLTIPCGFSGVLPIGMQLIGKQFDEANLYRFGYAFEQETK